MTTIHLDRPAVTLPPTTEETVHAVWTCRVRGCTNRVRVSDAVLRTTWRWTRPAIGKERRPIAKRSLLTTSPRCDEHNLRMHGKEIVGTFDENIACGPKCTAAIGHSCRCACGGANHGTAVTP